MCVTPWCVADHIMVHNKDEPKISLRADAPSGSLVFNSELPFKSKKLCLNAVFYYNLKRLTTMSGLSLLSFQTADDWPP